MHQDIREIKEEEIKIYYEYLNCLINMTNHLGRRVIDDDVLLNNYQELYEKSLLIKDDSQ
jgi:hypothetical protein